jgi:integrase
MPKKRNTKLPAIKQLPSGAYHASVYSHTDADGKRHYESFTGFDYNQVLLEVAQFKADKKQDKLEQAIAGTKLTVADAMDQYIDSKSAILSPSTIASYKAIRRNNLLDLQPLLVTKVTQELVQISINKEAMSKTPKTVRNIHGFLAAVLQVYRPDLILRTTLPQKVKAEIAIPTEEEIRLLLNTAKGTEMEIPLILAACCGMRRSEIAALTWKDVDFGKNNIKIKKALVMDDDNELVEKTTKTTAGTRTIRMFPVVSETLINYKEAHPDDGGYISIRPDIISHRFEKLVKRTGIQHYRFHDLRHYTVSVMLSLNIPKNYIADFVGHETENMIDKVYGHIMQSRKTSVEDQMQEYFAKFL